MDGRCQLRNFFTSPVSFTWQILFSPWRSNSAIAILLSFTQHIVQWLRCCYRLRRWGAQRKCIVHLISLMKRFHFDNLTADPWSVHLSAVPSSLCSKNDSFRCICRSRRRSKWYLVLSPCDLSTSWFHHQIKLILLHFFRGRHRRFSPPFRTQ